MVKEAAGSLLIGGFAYLGGAVEPRSSRFT